MKQYKRFMVFEIIPYETHGIDECVPSFDTLEEVKEFLKDKNKNNTFGYHYQTFDRIQGREVRV